MEDIGVVGLLDFRKGVRVEELRPVVRCVD